ncbi:phage tail tube protein [Streptomyces sp. NPDC048516]|uniref:phage tail tube protein n=1 Tax=Streptomyces sp. NPDC048516 TaxID=3365565 RepID=UPI00371B38F0
MAANSRPIDARGWLFEVLDATVTGTETWLPIAGLTSFTHNPGENEETAETTAFDSDGYYEQDVMQRGATLEIEGLYRIDPTTKAQDAGQAYVDKVWAYRLGIDSNNKVRWRHKSQTTWVVWDSTMTPGEQGGETNDKTSWSATITRSGKPTTAPVAGGQTLAAKTVGKSGGDA